MTTDERNAKVMDNLRLVHHTTRRMADHGKRDRSVTKLNTSFGGHRHGRSLERDADDVFQSGVLGLIEAVDRPSPPDLAFSTVACIRIRTQAIRGACLNRGGVRLPTNAAVELVEFRRVEKAIRDRTGRAPAARSVVAAMGLRGSRAKRVATLARDFGLPGGLVSRASVFTLDESEGRPPERATLDDREAVSVALASLPPRQARVVTLRAGLDGGGERGFREIGREMGFSYQRAQALYSEALLKMRKRLGDESEAA